MPLKINGTFWTIEELARVMGCSLQTAIKRVSREGAVYKIGQSFLIPETIARMVVDNEANAILPTRLLTRLKIAYPTFQSLVREGLPHIRRRGRLAIPVAYIPVFEEVFNQFRKFGKLESDTYEEVVRTIKEKINQSGATLDDFGATTKIITDDIAENIEMKPLEQANNDNADQNNPPINAEPVLSLSGGVPAAVCGKRNYSPRARNVYRHRRPLRRRGKSSAEN